MTAHRKRSG